MTENREQKRNVGAGPRARPKRGQPRGVASTILGILCSVFCSLSSVLCVDVLAIEWPWQNGKKEGQPSGFTSKQVEERTEVNRSRVRNQFFSAGKGTVIHSGLNSTSADIYDENGVVTRLDLDLNHDGKVRSDDFLLASNRKGSGAKEDDPMSQLLMTIPEGSLQKNFLEQLYAGRTREESALLVKEISVRKTEIEQIDQNLLPGIDKTERLLMKDLLEFQDRVEGLEEQLLRFGVAISKTEDGTEQVQMPENVSQSSTVKKFLLERRQLLIQTAKIKDLIEAQELYRSKALKRKRELEKEVQGLAALQSELEREQSKFRP